MSSNLTLTAILKDFGLLYRDCSQDGQTFRQSRYYLRAGDLRAHGYQSVWHMYCIPDRAGQISRVFDTDPAHQLLSGNVPEPTIADCGSAAYLMGRGLRSIVDEMGIHHVCSMLNEGSPVNASRILRTYAAFLPREFGIDGNQLFQRFRESVSRQLAA